ncbi:MAG TPA: type II secretion system F family protein [Pyrinomonadaceae bacterium]|nr:type II secretion system F family protein [Chloracidobacterium sp.]MBP9935911.1 type II secretion system F family protein [Pyrinomonadaceae bacterium]MBK7801109.1 type II secretion system F family protein [Chloracidobacterium sp.]MBK9436433.1 type II secretion system F family protein [Chloracidobacterium sp.]MBL0241415.1 type II secretion system F family protein [Chloracidobacterium sp.]
MPTFAFKGRNRLNELVTGEREAATQDELRALLRREQIVMTQASEKGREISIPKLGTRKKVKAKELAVFTRQFSVMIDAGLPLVQCLDILAEQQLNAFFKDVLRQVRQSVEEGSTLFAALQKHPKVFDSLFTHMVEAGETGGVLDLILQRLATLIEKVVKLKRSIVSASIYPAAVITVAIGAIAIIMIVVIPQFEQIFLGLLGPGEALPLPTRIVMSISGFIAGWGGLTTLVVLIASGIGISTYYKTPKGRWQIDALLLKTPIFGSILRKVGVARFSRILSTLLSSGVPILQSLDITAKTAGNVIIEDAILKVRAGVERGENFVDPLKATNVFPHMVGQMIGVGEQTGALDAMLGKIADFYEEEVDTAIADLLGLMEPVLIAFLGVTIGGIVISMYLPLFSLIGKLAGGAK